MNAGARRIALVVPFFGPDLPGSAQLRAYEIASVLAARGNALDVLTTCARSPSDDWSSNYFRSGIDRSERFSVHRFPVGPRDRGLYERADALFASLAERPNWTNEAVVRAEELAIVRHGVISDELVAHTRANATYYDAYLFLSYRDSLTFAALPAVAERAVLLPYLRREPFAMSASVQRVIRQARALAFSSEDEYALAVSLYGPGIVEKSHVLGPIARMPGPLRIERVAGFELRRTRYVAALADGAPPRSFDALLRAYDGFVRSTDSDVRFVLGGAVLAGAGAGVRACGALSGAEREALVAGALAVVHVDGDDPVAEPAVEALVHDVPVVVGVQTPALSDAVRAAGAGWLADDDEGLRRAFGEIATASPERIAALGSHAHDVLERLGGYVWPQRLEGAIDKLQGIEDGRTRDAALAQVAYLYPLVRRMRADISAMQRSRFWRLRDVWFGAKARLGIGAGDDLRRYDDATDAAVLTAVGDPYFIWIEQHRLRDEDVDRMRSLQRFFPVAPVFGIGVAIGSGVTSRELEITLESLRAQIYERWDALIELPPERADLADLLERLAAVDTRLHRGPADGADGDFLTLLHGADALSPDALFAFAARINEAPGVDVLYADVDTIDRAGRRSKPFFKPDWSPETALGRNLFTGLTFVRAGTARAVGGLRAGTGYAGWYDVALRATERSDRVAHLPLVAAHCRVAGDDAALVADELRVVRDALARRGEDATVEPAAGDGIPARVVRYRPRSRGGVTIVIPTRDGATMLERCLASIFDRTTYAEFSVLVIDNGSVEPQTRELLATWARREPARFRVLGDASPFNFAALNNRAVATVDSDFVAFLNNDTVVIAPDWLESLVGYCERPQIGAAGALLLYPDETVQHAGVVLGILGLAGHAHRHFPAAAPGYYGALQSVTNYSAVTGACMMIDRRRFLSVGGFDERFAVAWNDVDLCLRLREHGFRNVYLPHVRAYHFESKTRGADDTPAKVARAMSELQAMRERWPAYTVADPYYSRWLTTDGEDFSLRL